MASRNSVNKADPIPRYLQVRRILEDTIRSGKYGPGARLPGERELAKNLNVSQMTVNKAVLALVQEGWLHREVGNGTFVQENFRPPLPATLRIGFVAPMQSDHILDDSYLAALIRGIQRVVVNEAVSLSLMEAPEDSLFERVQAADLDGYLITGISARSVPELARLDQEGIRAVVMGSSWEDLTLPLIDSNNYGGTQAAVGHLLNEGHKRIAGIFAFMNSCNTQHRLQAFRDSLAAQGCPLPPEYVLEFENNDLLHRTIGPRIQALLQTAPPTAFFCGGYSLALEVMQAIRLEGMQIPEEISVIGFDDHSSASLLTPPLTTVRQPLNQIGQRAMEKLLVWLRTGQRPERAEVLPTEIVWRASAAPPGS